MRTAMTIVKSIFTSVWTYRILRFLLAGIFLYSGVVKLMDVNAFAFTINEFKLVPRSLLWPAAWGVPILEVVLGLGVLFFVPGFLAGVGAMLLVFIGVLWWGMANDLAVDCGCFGPAELDAKASIKNAFIRDLVMLAGLCWTAWLGRLFPAYRKRPRLSAPACKKT